MRFGKGNRTMKVRIPNQGGGQAAMMKKVQQMQEDMQNKQAVCTLM